MGPTGAFCFYGKSMFGSTITVEIELPESSLPFDRSTAGLNVLAFIMIFFWVPETKGVSDKAGHSFRPRHM